MSERMVTARILRTSLPGLTAGERGARPPLSWPQRALWLVEQLHTSSSLYNVPFAVRLEGPLDAGALQGALRQIVERHEIFRTTFPTLHGQAYQRVSSDPAMPLPVTDLTGLPAPARE